MKVNTKAHSLLNIVRLQLADPSKQGTRPSLETKTTKPADYCCPHSYMCVEETVYAKVKVTR